MTPVRQNAQKQSQKFCRSKEGKNSETHPEKPEKGETGCVPGAGEGCSRYGRVGKPEIRTKMHQIAMQHMKKGNRRKPSVFAGFLAGAEGLSLAGRLGRFAAERHWRSLTPRHAVLEWIWESTPGSGEVARLDGFPGQSTKVWCCSGATRKNPAQNSQGIRETPKMYTDKLTAKPV